MATILIGGVSYTIPELNFLAIERAWPSVVAATEALDPMKGVSAALGVFAAGIMELPDFKPEDFGIGDRQPQDPLDEDERIHSGVIRFLKRNLKGTELDKVRETMFEVLKEAGLEVTEGELKLSLQEAGIIPEENDLTETVLPTSPSSSQPELKEEVGTV